MTIHTKATKIGKTEWRDQHTQFGIRDADRLQHIYCIGKTGTGKSTLLQNMAVSDIERGNGLCVIDPHGDLALHLLDYIPKSRIADTIYFDAGDLEHPIAFNPLSGIAPHLRHLALAGLISTFHRLWNDSWGPRLEYTLRYALLSLMLYPSATLLDIQPLLTDDPFRNIVLSYVQDANVRRFWSAEFDKYTAYLKADAISPILNKMGLFLALEPLKRIFGQTHGSLQLREALDTKKILIVNLSKGIIGEDAAVVLGSLLVSSIQLAALSRADQPERDREPFYLYIDEAHNFIGESLVGILSETRKYKLSLFLANQYLEQLSEELQAAIFGNIGTLIAFRVGAADARILEREFYSVFTADDLVKLPRYHIYLKLMIDGMTSKPFSAITLPPSPPMTSYKSTILAQNEERNIPHQDKPSPAVRPMQQPPTLFD